MFTFRRWWLLCGAVLVGVVALNGVVNGVVDAKVRPVPRAVCVRGGAKARDAVSGRGLVCVRTKVRGLRWQFRPTAVTTTTTTTTTSPSTTTTVPGVVAPRLVSVSASDGVRVTVAGMRPDTGVYSLQWVLYGQTFNTYQMARATSPSMNVPAGWFACNRTYTFRVFVMQADWQLADGHQTQNVTPHSTPFDVVMPACTTPTTTPTTTPPGVALTPSFGAPTSTADGFTVQISNYDALFTWAGTATASGVVAISGSGLVTVSGVAARTSSTATITTERSGYSGGSATVTAASQCDPGVVCVVGDTGPGGGIVFYVQASGTFACGATLASTCKYLEVAPNTWSGGSADPTKLWAIVAHQSSDIATIANDSSAYNNALGIGLGYTNSLAIVGQGNDTTTAAGAARAYDGGTQSDWYLPTTAELNLLCQWASNVAQSVTTPCTGGTLNTGTGASGGFSSGYYWSSSEVAANNAWVQYFDEGAYQDFNAKKNFPLEVRPVRAFG